MDSITLRQQEVLDFIRSHQSEHGVVPTLREIARHFEFRSMTAAADHVRSLRRKGYLAHTPRLARSHRVLSPLDALRHPSIDIPILGIIAAGCAELREQEAVGCVTVDAETLGIRPRAAVFALRVKGDSMIDRHILHGDVVIIERGPQPRSGDVVAALIDGESTLKTFVIDKGQPCLRAENPNYPTLIPVEEMVIQGVMVGLLRRGQADSSLPENWPAVRRGVTLKASTRQTK
jgi:repressor LexA